MLYYSAALLIGFLILFRSADQFVMGSVATARNLNITPMTIGLTVVALGTSAPEIFVSATSSFHGEPDIAVGNAIGSNIANLGLVLGTTALIIPLRFRVDILRNDLPILIFITLCAGACMIDFYLGMWDGLLLISALLLFLFRIRVEHKRSSSMEVAAEILDLEEFPDMSGRKAMITLSFSLILLLFSSELLVWAAIGIAQYLEVSELIIGLTVIAIGTSIPELVVSLTSALKGQTDLAIGNIIGSNIFNILTVLSIPAIFAPSVLDPLTLWRDYGLMFGMTMLLVIFAFKLGGHSGISRIRGGLLFSLWLGYIIFIYQTALVA
jgi:cation:H+ antiporter|tara:strand:- start:6939 stop:7910 length:972 start_codon:yes stop_codon:yes gene_type:complete